jgi:hypothetical protein
MKGWNRLLVHVACSGLIFSSIQAVALPGSGPTGVDGSSSEATVAALPDSPGTTRAQSQDQSSPNNPQREPDTQAPAPPQNDQAPDQSQPQAQPQSSQAPSSQTQRPVGTAAAETSNGGGVAASQPAGVAIAPAKQRRIRTMVLRVGAIVGAGVAVGTVMALTQATPSRPPGAH